MVKSFKDISDKVEQQFNFEMLHKDRKMDRKIAKENIVLLKDIFEKHNIKYWLCFGTLLGAIRENNFIEHDVDTDIGVDFVELNKLEASLSDIQNSGFEIIRVTTDLTLVSLLRKNEYIDIYLFRKTKYNRSMSWYCAEYVVKEDYFSKLEKIQFLGEYFYAPVDRVNYLEEVYGADWKIPKINAHAQPINNLEEIYRQYYLLLNRWLEYNLRDETVSDLLETRGIKKVIVFGMGNIGKRLIQDLKKSKYVQVEGVIDGVIKKEKYEDYRVIKKEELCFFNDAVIIITPFCSSKFIKEELFSINEQLVIFGIDEIIK